MIRCLAARPLPFGAQLGCIGSWRNKNLINFTKICNRNGSSMSVPPKDFRLDEFCLRQFNDENYSGTRVTGISPSEFLATVNDAYRAKPTLKEGYAPFCKHFFMPNFLVSMKVGDMPITEENRALLRVGYKARTEKELPVLSSWFPVDSVTPPEATYLDVILYSKDQIIKENKAMGTDHPPGEDEEECAGKRGRRKRCPT
eukprot:TRINITY_DN5555_c0_g1_i1.p1 TRINITY_DN5555_c0_g1~~TRINITY_DN5555_c0_g1_i1.p1  ORF type:complete len:200 (+),score=17.39 TRINITY_DN5555_c0_g1_i1:231-830(+)